RLRTAGHAAAGNGRSLIGGTAGSEQVGDGDRRDNADDHDDDEKFDKREAFLVFHLCIHDLLELVGVSCSTFPRRGDLIQGVCQRRLSGLASVSSVVNKGVSGNRSGRRVGLALATTTANLQILAKG